MTVKLIIFVSLILHIEAQLEQCFVDIDSPYKRFSSKASYHAGKKSQINIPEDCTPIYIWALIRHGTRYPGSKFIADMKELYDLRDNIIQNHKEGRGRLCAKDLNILEKWKTNLTVDHAYDLTSQGLEDEILLARRLKEKFPNLLTQSNGSSFVFQSSAVKRAKDSAIVFTNELLNTNYTDSNGNHIAENEYLLHIGKYTCPSYAKELENNNPSVFEELKLFEQSEFMKKVISDISTRIGFQQPLSFSSVRLMYDTCAYESAWFLNSKPAFCVAFLKEQLKVFEYHEDMELYYKIGYGNSFSEKVGCPVVRDMMTSLVNAAKNTKQDHKATFYFSHSEMILPTLVKLGLNRDAEPLKHDNYERLRENRKWELTFFDTFAANIITVLYKCSGPQGDQYKVILYENEQQIVLPKCTQNPCVLENLIQNFPDVFNETQCNLKFCEITKSNSTKSKENKTILISSLILFLCTFMGRFLV